MKPISIKTLIHAINAGSIIFTGSGSQEAENKMLISGVSTDSRTVKKGDCFFAIEGDNFDGHLFLDDVFEKGAACAIVSKDTDSKISDKNCVIKADDTVKALGRLAKYYRKESNYKVVAITGSAGKTTTRQIIYTVLSRHFKTFQSPKNFNNFIGLPITLLSADDQTEIVVAELGTNHPGEIPYLTDIANPDIAVITNVSAAHLEGLGNIEEIVKEKASIADGLRPGGLLVMSADFEPLLEARRSKKVRLVTFGQSDSADIRAENITYKGSGSQFAIDNISVELGLLGPANIQNSLAGWAVCREIGIELKDFADAVKTLPAMPMRLEPIKLGEMIIINDCYNANPASMQNALQVLSSFGQSKDRRFVFICGDMAELGEDSEKLHRELGEYISRLHIQLLLTVGPLSKIAAETASRADGALTVKSFDDTDLLCNNLQKFVKDTDIILVKGSRAVRLEAAVEKLKELFAGKTAGFGNF
jgi:UDP-N-acetylmuramoyl-tripeptide--D-alanyl-D-alanine ligase